MDNVVRLMEITEKLANIRRERDKLVAEVNTLEGAADELIELRDIILNQMRKEDTSNA